MMPLLVVTVVNLVSVPLFYRYLGPEMYALWFYVLTFTGAFGFMDLGLGVAVGRYMGVALGRADTEAVREYWGTGNAIALPLLGVMALVFILAGVGFGPHWFKVAPEHVDLLRWSFVAGGAGLFFSYYAQFWLILSQTHLDFKFLAILRTSVGLLQVLPSILLAWATHNPLILIFWTAVISALQLAVFVWHARRRYQFGFSLSYARWVRAREMALYTGKTFASLLINSILGSADRLVVGGLAPAADFAHYTISANAGARIQGLSAAVMGPVFSNTNRAVGTGNRQSLAAVYNETFDFTFPWYLLVSFWTVLWHSILLRLWLGAKLSDAVAPIFVPVIIACCIGALGSISSAQLGSLNRIGTGLIFNLATTLLLVAGVYWGWKWAGVAGVAWGFLASRVAVIAQDLYVIRLIQAGGWLATNTWRHVAKQAAFALACAGPLWLWPVDSVWQIVPAAIHGGAVAAWLVRHPVRNALARMRPRLALGVA
jgi:O-antigen/teichoic acid export membrane protein